MRRLNGSVSRHVRDWSSQKLAQTLKRNAAESSSGQQLYTLAQLQAASRDAARRLQDVGKNIQQELESLTDRIPIVVRAIWGERSAAVVDALKQQQQLAARLIRQWETAEHRLIAVANSLSVSNSGQKLLAVGIPLAASELLRSTSSTAYAYHSPMVAAQRPSGAQMELSLGQLAQRVQKLAAALAEEAALALRGLYLFLLFLPVVLTSPVMALVGRSSEHRAAWLSLMRWTLERAGPAFIKWGQWAATRPDMFPADVCTTLALLQTKAPQHSAAHSVAAVEAAFGQPLANLFAEFDPEPVASGSIAQVHRAVLSEQGARMAARRQAPRGLPPLPFLRRRADPLFCEGATVAVKVRHPGVTTLMVRDFTLMQRCALVLASLPLVGNPQLKDSLMQFGAPLKEQLDLKVEAENLNRFGVNFRNWRGVRFPEPAAAPLVSSDVLVESFEEGELMNRYLDAKTPINKRLAELGSSCYLKMLLKDNFIHADLHPGNILVRMEEPAPQGSMLGTLARALRLAPAPRLVLLDVGMIARLTCDDQRHLVDFFKSITDLDGTAVANSIMAFSEEGQSCLNPAGFRADMHAVFDGIDHEYLRENTTEVISEMMDTIRRHQVPLKGVVSTVVISTVVLEGWSTKLDPDIRIMESLKEVLPSSWGERISKTVDRVMASSTLALTV